MRQIRYVNHVISLQGLNYFGSNVLHDVALDKLLKIIYTAVSNGNLPGGTEYVGRYYPWTIAFHRMASRLGYRVGSCPISVCFSEEEVQRTEEVD